MNSPSRQGGVLRRALDRLGNSTGHQEETELRHQREASGCAPVVTYGDRDMVRLHGTLSTVTLRPRGAVCALEAEIFDGSGTVKVVWLGRRRIAGIVPGRHITVEGRLGQHNGVRVLFNPRYELSA